MNPQSKRIFRYILFAFVGVSIVYMGYREVMGGPRSADTGSTANHAMIVYYFSEGKECSTCEQIEEVGHAIVREEFADEIEAGDVAWRVVDMDTPGNQHYATQYNLYTKSIVLVAYKDGEEIAWQNLEKVWDYVYDEAKLSDYVREEAKAFWETHR